MNDRIRHLAKKSGLLSRKFMFGEYYYDELSDEQLEFAELIVKQCGYYADIFESLGCSVDMDPTETKPSDYIKKHFGVEE
jgi:hypothetical protein